jgi:hypothetical protein
VDGDGPDLTDLLPHVLPSLAAVGDLKTPAPGETFPRMFASPLPTYTTFGSDGATATLPIELVGWSRTPASS